MSEYILEAQNLYFKYPDGTQALNGMNMRIQKGKKIAVLGSNGAGKSTLFLNFNGVLRPSAGKILFNGKEVQYKRKELNSLRKSIGIVFQDPDSQLFSASVYQEVSFGAVNLKLSDKEVRMRVDDALEDTGITHLKDKPTHFLSYGQKKRVSIADILVMHPEVIICDEPTACLDPKHTLKIMTLFESLNQKGTTIILSTHDVEIAWSWADYVYIMKEGRIEGEGTPEEVFDNSELLMQIEMKKPVILEVYEELAVNGLITRQLPIPKTIEELKEIIKKERSIWKSFMK